MPNDPAELPSTNPVGTFDFRLTVPDIEVRMVNASGLADYEIWLFIASASFSAAVGFVVDYFPKPATGDRPLDSLVVSGVFFVIFVVTFARALWLRHAIVASSKAIRMRATEVRDPPTAKS